MHTLTLIHIRTLADNNTHTLTLSQHSYTHFHTHTLRHMHTLSETLTHTLILSFTHGHREEKEPSG